MEAVSSHKMLVLMYLTAWHHITDDRKLHSHLVRTLNFTLTQTVYINKPHTWQVIKTEIQNAILKTTGRFQYFTELVTMVW